MYDTNPKGLGTNSNLLRIAGFGLLTKCTIHIQQMYDTVQTLHPLAQY